MISDVEKIIEAEVRKCLPGKFRPDGQINIRTYYDCKVYDDFVNFSRRKPYNPSEYIHGFMKSCLEVIPDVKQLAKDNSTPEFFMDADRKRQFLAKLTDVRYRQIAKELEDWLRAVNVEFKNR